MKVHIVNYQPERTGGGWTAAKYLHEGLEAVSYEEADVVLVTGPTMASHDQVEQAKRDGKKVVLRLDNVVRNSRNRSTGMTRMKAFCESADLVIYQSEWARKFLYPFTGKDGVVILNGVDTTRFKPGSPPDESYLYVRSSNDEGKQWVMAWYWFVNNPGRLTIVGRFSPENLEYNFDFYNGERYLFLGQQTEMADIYRNNRYFLYTYLNEAGSNTLLEARASGCEIVNVYGMLDTGCAPEYMACKDISIQRTIGEYKEAMNVLV